MAEESEWIETHAMRRKSDRRRLGTVRVWRDYDGKWAATAYLPRVRGEPLKSAIFVAAPKEFAVREAKRWIIQKAGEAANDRA